MTDPKVLIIGPLPPPIGGQSILVHDIYKGLQESNKPVEVFNIAHEIHSSIQRLFTSIRWMFLLAISLWRDKPSIIHIHSSAGIPLLEKLLFACIARVAGKKTILHMHGGKMATLWSGYPSLLKSLFRALINKLCSRLIVLSDSWRGFYIDQVGISIPIDILPNGVRVPIEVQEKEDCETIKIIFLGKLCSGKGLYDLAEALNDLFVDQKILLQLVGPIDKVDENKLLDTFQRLNTSENIEVQMLGVKLGIDKWQLLSGSDILILPSHSEDLPISVIEAICLGKPVIATKVGSLADLVEEGVNGILVEPKDAAKLRAAIEMLVSDKLLRDRMSEAALSLSRKYNFDKYLEDLNKIYQSCD